MVVTKNFLSLFHPDIKDLDNNQLVEFLMLSGIEVNKTEYIQPPCGEIYYGIIKDFSKVEGSSKLNLCKVEIPYLQKTYQIVCGASNVKNNMKVVVALPGAVLSNGEIKISKRKMCGIESEGMICSYSELYKSSILTNLKSFEGRLLDLGVDFEINKLYSPEDLGLDDFIMNLFIPDNRADLTTTFGLAKEIQKLFNLNPEKFTHLFLDAEPVGFDDISWKWKKFLFTNNVSVFTKPSSKFFYYMTAFNYYFFEFKEDVCQSPSGVYDVLYGCTPSDEISKWNFLGNDIEINLKELASFLKINEEQVKQIINYLEKYDYKFEPGKIQVPSYRHDLRDQRDFSEELTRLPIYKKFYREKCLYLCTHIKLNDHLNSIQKIKEFWRNRGFFECSTFNLTNPDYFPNGVRVVNPQSKFRSVIREHALYELIDVIAKNNRRKNKLRPVFEVFYSLKWGYLLNIVIPEVNNKFALNETNFSNDLIDLLSLLHRCFEYLDTKWYIHPSDFNYAPFYSKNLHEIRDSEFNKCAGYVGYLKSCLPFKLWGCMIRLEMYHCFPQKYRKTNSPSIYPVSMKDISIFIPVSSSLILGNLIREIREIEGLKNLEVVDKYSIEEGNKYLLRCYFQSHDKTFTKEEINSYMQEIYDNLESQGVKVYK